MRAYPSAVIKEKSVTQGGANSSTFPPPRRHWLSYMPCEAMELVAQKRFCQDLWADFSPRFVRTGFIALWEGRREYRRTLHQDLLKY